MKKRTGREIALVNPPASTEVVRRFGDVPVLVDRVFHVPSLQPKAKGPWSREAEKVAWTDAGSGFGCIIRRSPTGGHLCGYVGIGPGHPLHGYQPDALAGIGIRAHGGIGYAEPCQDSEPEPVSVCHVPPKVGPVREERIHVRNADADDLWWIGFACNQPYDVVPDAQRFPGTHTALDGTVPRAYRDEAYVLGQCEWLAGQLKAVEEGRSPYDVNGPPTPAIGIDPKRSGGVGR